MAGRALVAGVIAAGLLRASAASAAPAVPTDAGERAEALLLGGAINRFVAKQLPTTFSVRGDRDAGIGAQDVTLVDARYCGGGKDGSRGRLVGVLRPDGATGTLPSVDAHDCRAKLEEVARRLAAAPDAGAIAVVELVAEWVPWELRVAIGDVAAGGDVGRGLARTRRARRPRDRSRRSRRRAFAWRRNVARRSPSIRAVVPEGRRRRGVDADRRLFWLRAAAARAGREPGGRPGRQRRHRRRDASLRQSHGGAVQRGRPAGAPAGSAGVEIRNLQMGRGRGR